jgi:hypothetical protein
METGGNSVAFYEFYEQIVDIIPRLIIIIPYEISNLNSYCSLVVGLFTCRLPYTAYHGKGKQQPRFSFFHLPPQHSQRLLVHSSCLKLRNYFAMSGSNPFRRSKIITSPPITHSNNDESVVLPSIPNDAITSGASSVGESPLTSYRSFYQANLMERNKQESILVSS